MVIVPFTAELHDHHNDRPPSLPACLGWPGSFVAKKFLAFVGRELATRTVRLVKLSLCGKSLLVKKTTLTSSKRKLVRPELNCAENFTSMVLPMNGVRSESV